MPNTKSDNTRILSVTAGNLRQNHLYVTGHHDFFPKSVIGHPKRNGNRGVDIVLDGLGETVNTDIGTDAKTGKPRNFFRCRGWVRRFYEHHGVADGAQLRLTRIDRSKYRLSLESNGASPSHKPRIGEFFAGIGLVRLAFERQGWEVVFANDIDPDKAAMYRLNWPNDNHLVVEDIHKLSADAIPTCDLFTASFPCNDLSIAGRWEGLNGKESSAFWGLTRLLEELGERRPPTVLLENVVGFLMSQGGKDFETALLELNRLGYAVDAFILNAMHWVPQSRARLFVVAKLAVQSANPIAIQCDARPPGLVDFVNTHRNIRWDINSLPSLPKRTTSLVNIVQKLRDQNQYWWNEERVNYFWGQLSARHLHWLNK